MVIYNDSENSPASLILYSMCIMRALQVDRLQRRRGLADGCKGLSSGSPHPMGFHSSSYYARARRANFFGPTFDFENLSTSWVKGQFYLKPHLLLQLRSSTLESHKAKN